MSNTPLPRTNGRTHELKTVAPFFADIYHGHKTAELRKHDRPFRVGDTLILREYSPGLHHYSGSKIVVEVTHLVTDRDGPWLADGYCMLSFKVLELIP